MKLFNFKKIISLTAAVCVSVCSVSAAVIDTAVLNTNTNTITVRGNMQNVPTLKSSGNIMLDSEGNGEGNVWVGTSGTKVASCPESEGSENNVIKATNRTADYCGIKQDLYAQLSEYGLGSYRLSGKIKAETYTGKVTVYPTAGTTIGGATVTSIDNATISTGNAYFNITLLNQSYTLSVNGIGEEWTEFSGIINVEKYGYTDSSKKTELTAFDANKTYLNMVTSNSTYATNSEGNKFVNDAGEVVKIRDTRNILIDDVTLEKVESVDVFKGIETANVAVLDAQGDIVYVNETTTTEDGDYAISFQLPDGVEANGLKAKINGKNTVPYEEADIVVKEVDTNIKTVYTGNKVKVTFDIFDFFDSSEYSDVVVLAASYMPDDNICDISLAPVTIDLAASTTQSIELDPPTGDVGYVKLFLVNNFNQLKPLCTVHSTDVTLTEATLYLVGDSICTPYYDEKNQYVQRGWGQYIGEYLSDKITVYNGAHGGFSTASFMVSDTYRGNWGGHSWNCETVVNSAGYVKEATPILPMIEEGDYVIVSLGINDSSIQNDPNSAKGVTIEDYKGYLRQMAQDTADKGATMIFATPTISAYQNSDGTYNLSAREYAQAMQAVAEEIGVVCVDLGNKLRELYAKSDRDTVEKYHLYNKWLTASEADGGFGLTADQIASHSNEAVKKGGDDRTHLSSKGADFVAKTIAGLVADSPSTLGKYVTDNAN